MFGVGPMELALIVILGILFLGPTQFLQLARFMVRTWFQLKGLLRRYRDEVMSHPEIRDIVEEFEDLDKE